MFEAIEEEKEVEVKEYYDKRSIVTRKEIKKQKNKSVKEQKKEINNEVKEDYDKRSTVTRKEIKLGRGNYEYI